MCLSFHKVNKTVQGKSLTEFIILAMIMEVNGTEGRVVTCEGQQYYVDQNGKMLVNRWKDGY